MSDRLESALLVLLLLAHLALLSQQEVGGTSRFERYALAVFGPLVGGVGTVAESAGDLGRSVRTVGELRRDNRRLRRELTELRSETVRLQGVEEELDRLSRLTGYRRTATGEHFVADVVYVDPSSWLRTLVLHTGAERARRDQPVVTDRGLVGRIVSSSGSYAKVLLLTDPSAAAGAMIQRTRRKGLVRGAGDHLRLENIPALSDVRVGDRVVTGGLDGVFPRGIPVGVVTRVEEVAERGTLFRSIRVAPAVDLGLLDQVYVLTRSPLPEGVRSELVESEEESR